jgi:hypothetical protein
MWPACITAAVAAVSDRTADRSAEGDKWINGRMQIMHPGPS